MGAYRGYKVDVLSQLIIQVTCSPFDLGFPNFGVVDASLNLAVHTRQNWTPRHGGPVLHIEPRHSAESRLQKGPRMIYMGLG